MGNDSCNEAFVSTYTFHHSILKRMEWNYNSSHQICSHPMTDSPCYSIWLLNSSFPCSHSGYAKMSRITTFQPQPHGPRTDKYPPSDSQSYLNFEALAKASIHLIGTTNHLNHAFSPSFNATVPIPLLIYLIFIN